MYKNPLISVLIPAYNAEKYIAEAVESIINQTYKNLEILIINDCSTDNTEKIIRKYMKRDSRIVLINNTKNLRISKTLNKGLKKAKGKYIVRMDSDDWSYPTRIEKQKELMEKNPNIVLSSGNMEICDNEMTVKNKSNLPTSDRDIRKVLLQYNPMVHPAMIYKRETALSIGGYDEEIKSEDYMFTIDMSSKGDLANLNDILIKYRILDSSLTAEKMTAIHLATLQCVFKGHLKYGIPINNKTKIYNIGRLFVAYFIPTRIWRFISTILRR